MSSSEFQSEQAAPWEEIPSGETFSQDEETFGSPEETESNQIPPEKAPLIDEIAMEFVGFWNRLISQTNWEKGRVIQTWRLRLMDAGLPRSVYSDEAISQRIGNVSSQHIGRLRRVYERFGNPEAYRENDRFTNLYWSHYQAALDWEDADEWLNKASAEGLSVAMMRIARWEKYGAPEDRKPKENEVVAAEPDEDVNPMNDSEAEFIDILDPNDSEGKENKEKKSRENSEKDESRQEGNENGQRSVPIEGNDDPWGSPVKPTGEILREMNEFPQLPQDLADAVENLKEAIINHKLTGWEAVSQEDLLKWIGALRGIVLSEE